MCKNNTKSSVQNDIWIGWCTKIRQYKRVVCKYQIKWLGWCAKGRWSKQNNISFTFRFAQPLGTPQEPISQPWRADVYWLWQVLLILLVVVRVSLMSRCPTNLNRQRYCCIVGAKDLNLNCKNIHKFAYKSNALNIYQKNFLLHIHARTFLRTVKNVSVIVCPFTLVLSLWPWP